MMIVGMDHVQLAMPAGAEALARQFYEGVLGLTEVEKPDSLQGRGGCWFVGPGAHIHLGVQADFAPARKAHPALLADDVEGLYVHLHEAGVLVQWDEALPGVRRFYTADPFGNRLEFVQNGQGFSQQEGWVLGGSK